MSKWTDSFKKPITGLDTTSTCQCTSNQGLFVPNRQLSALVAGLLFLFFCVFITGYFLGKKCAVEQYTQTACLDAADDNLYLSKVLDTENEVIHENKDIVLAMNADSTITSTVPHEDRTQNEMVATINHDQEEGVALCDDQKKYYAQLIGFGTEKAAQQFVTRLSLNGIITEVKKRVSKTIKGRTSYWYQVVTTAYSNKNELTLIVDKLVKAEKLKDVCIQTC